MKTATWRHAEVFPIIEQIIRRNRGWLLNYEIGDALYADREGSAIIDNAARLQGNPTWWVACNMVAWYSKRVTEGTWRCPFTRKMVKRFTRENHAPQWAYKRR
jgi:hypothetical protein